MIRRNAEWICINYSIHKAAGTRNGSSPHLVAGGKHEQQLDLHTLSNADFPTILFVHEDGLTSGDRKDEPYAKICATFQVIGIGCAATNYRLAPEHKWPAQPNDVAAAFAWLKHSIGARS